jgi:glutamine amidotransferase
LIALIDYGAGNLTSVRRAITALGRETFTPANPAQLDEARCIIVPGVGHFGATRALEGEWKEAVRAQIEGGKPLLGICLGLQWLFDGSEESADVRGLGFLSGRCRRLPEKVNGAERVKVPHVGWNSLTITRQSEVLQSVRPGAQAYFCHSFAAPITPDTIALSEHGIAFAAVVQRDNVIGCQFHPEKSGAIGLRFLQNFLGFSP